jgi:hypothetical protein
MALFIFAKNSDDIIGSLYRISPNQSDYNSNKNWNDELYDIVTVSDSDYNEVRLGKKGVIKKIGNEVFYSDSGYEFKTQDELTHYIKNMISCLNEYLVNNSSKPLASKVITYLNYLKSVDVSLIITNPDLSTNPIVEGVPLNSSLEEYAETQGVAPVSLLELL